MLSAGIADIRGMQLPGYDRWPDLGPGHNFAARQIASSAASAAANTTERFILKSPRDEQVGPVAGPSQTAGLRASRRVAFRRRCVVRPIGGAAGAPCDAFPTVRSFKVIGTVRIGTLLFFVINRRSGISV